MMVNNKENLFMHRLPGTISGTRLDDRPSSPITYWKSPYAKDRHSIFNNKGGVTGFMRPQMTVAASKLQHKLPMRESKSAFKGILKQSGGQEISQPEASLTIDDTTPRMPYGKPNLITTGTGSGRPHGVPERSQSSDKHVKFDRLPKPLSASDASVWTAGHRSFRPGKKLTVKRNVAPIRQLGSGLINYRTPAAYSSIVTLTGGEVQIKSQTEAFIKKLRMAESAKLAKMAADNDKDTQKQNATANKPTKKRSESAGRYFYDWKEFDLDNNHANLITPDSGTCYQENASDADGDNQVISGNELSDRDSLSSTTLDIADETTTLPVRSKSMASLYTKYRHITTNDVALHKYDDIYQDIVLGRATHRPDSVKGQNEGVFCDPQKASDIIGWLADVEIAKIDKHKSEAI